MNPLRLGLGSALLLWLAGGLNLGLSGRVGILGSSPDLVAVVISCIGLATDSRIGLGAGFAGGVIQSAMIGANAWQFMLSRSLMGWLTGYAAETRMSRNFLTAGLVTALTTLVFGLLMLFLTGERSFLAGLKATILSALYNGVLSLGLFVPIERSIGAHRRET